jgi:hypothetical protein
MPGNYVLLERVVVSNSLGSANNPPTSIVFNNIPQTGYSDLLIVGGLATATGGGQASSQGVYLNGDSTNNYNRIAVEAFSGSNKQSYGGTNTTFIFGGVATDAQPGLYGNFEYRFTDYAGSQPKTILGRGWGDYASSTLGAGGYYGTRWNSTAAINSVTILGTFAAGSTISLYAISSFGVTPAIAPQATGGSIISTDGTYWYHAFTSSGIFAPLKSLTCDVLVIGGGGGAASDAGGGGGGGGVLAFSSQSLTVQNYTVAVGAGGANAGLNLGGIQGSDSQFGTLTLVKGGGSGTRSGIGGTGGSGGGGSGRGKTSGDNPAGGSPTSGQGNSGGAGAGSSTGTSQSGGGGGGAGASGASAGSAIGGNGGVGTSTYSSWGIATATGQLSGGVRYYAGGGAGAPYQAGTFGSGGLGGGGLASSPGYRGDANTGGGGGSSANASVGAAGGSGIVIVRYPMV